MRRRLLTLAPAALPQNSPFPPPAEPASPGFGFEAGQRFVRVPQAVARRILDFLSPGQAEAEAVAAAQDLVNDLAAVTSAPPAEPVPPAELVEAGRSASLAQLRQLIDDQAATAQTLAQAADIIAQARATRATPSATPFSAPKGPPVPENAKNASRNVLAQNPLFLDYETTGLYLNRGAAVCEVSLMDAAGRVILHSLINPGISIPAEATFIHGLADGDVAGSPTWGDLAPLLRGQVAGRVVIAYNARFEAKFTPKDWGVKWLCAKKLADLAFGKAGPFSAQTPSRSGSLANRLRLCGLQPGPAHTAAGDNLSTLRLLRYIAGLEQI